MAYPCIDDVVSMSPTSIGARVASVLQNTFPIKANGFRFMVVLLLSRMRAGLQSPAPHTLPASRLSYSFLHLLNPYSPSIIITVPGSTWSEPDISKSSAQSALFRVISPAAPSRVMESLPSTLLMYTIPAFAPPSLELAPIHMPVVGFTPLRLGALLNKAKPRLPSVS